MIDRGLPAPLGAVPDRDGVNFAVYAGAAERLELCLFDAAGGETSRVAMPAQADGVWHGYLPGCRPGQHYGYRAHGRYAPDEGLRFNPGKLLLDPYARALAGQFRWSPDVFDFTGDPASRRMNPADSAAFVPKCVVPAERGGSPRRGPRIPWAETIIYEANVRGYTMRHPDVPESERGTFLGMKNGEILGYLRALGITSVELMPVHEFIDEEFLFVRGLRNFWGYNTIAFFTPAGRYACHSAAGDFVEMVDAIHDAGLEVIMDVAYNHTGESDANGPTLCFRGLDNLAYYRTMPDRPGEYVNDTGCGNTLNVDHERVRQLVLDSLRYWGADMGVDGFRFDLAPVLGRTAHGFSATHPLLQAIELDPVLQKLKFVAEPWDPGPGGYQLGHFPSRWAEWNDRYRDSLRRFWRADAGETPEFAKRLHGSADIFEHTGRSPAASINFITAHDGFTLTDVVSYEHRHNDANGEDNRDGHAHNFSCNYGVEGVTDDPGINALRRRQRLNMLATLLFSQGTPMLLAGDEFGNSQHGNNNAYAQDNEIGWLDWSGLDDDPAFQRAVRNLIRLRRELALLRQPVYLHGLTTNPFGWPDIAWLRPDGGKMHDDDWLEASAKTVILTTTPAAPGDGTRSVALLLNPSNAGVDFELPDPAGTGHWQAAFTSGDFVPPTPAEPLRCHITARALACLTQAGQTSRS